MVSLTRFFSQRSHMSKVLPYITCDASVVSLRLIDWFVTNYAKKHNTVISVGGNNPGPINVFLSYRAQLKAYSKQQFDPFRRRDRILFYHEPDQCVETTVGQLNFFRWMLVNGVLEYVSAHAAVIERDMLSAHKKAGSPSAPALGAPPASSSASASASASAKAKKATAAAAAQAASGATTKESSPKDTTAAVTRKKRAELSRCRATQNLTCMSRRQTVQFD
jgi:hypothetical protein